MSARNAVICVAVYAAAIFFLIPLRPLWLDEILQLLAIQHASIGERLVWVRQNAGAVPLGYEIPHWVAEAFGYTLVPARLLPALFSVLSLGVMLRLGREVGVRNLWILAALWALFPLQLRYSVEARPYSQALFFSALSTLLFLRLVRKPGVGLAILYALSVTEALYSQTYSVFLQVGLFASLVFSAQRKALMFSAASLAAAALLLTPWLAYSLGHWSGQHFHASWSLVPVLLRDLPGGGYVPFAMLLVLVILGFRSKHHLLLWGLAGCLILAIGVDIGFGYFFATRQVLFAVVPLCLLAAEGWVEAGARWGVLAQVVLLGLLGGWAVAKDISYFRDTSEDYQLTARKLELDSRRGCVLYAEDASLDLFGFFEPVLKERVCGTRPDAESVFVPLSKYTKEGEIQDAAARLSSAGYRLKSTGKIKAFEIREYERTAP